MEYCSNNNGANSGVQNYNYNSPVLNGIQSEVIKSMDKLPMSAQAKILLKVYKLTKKYLTKP